MDTPIVSPYLQCCFQGPPPSIFPLSPPKHFSHHWGSDYGIPENSSNFRLGLTYDYLASRQWSLTAPKLKIRRYEKFLPRFDYKVTSLIHAISWKWKPHSCCWTSILNLHRWSFDPHLSKFGVVEYHGIPGPVWFHTWVYSSVDVCARIGAQVSTDTYTHVLLP